MPIGWNGWLKCHAHYRSFTALLSFYNWGCATIGMKEITNYQVFN